MTRAASWTQLSILCGLLAPGTFAAQCDYSSKATSACDDTANEGSCADYFQLYATLDYQEIKSPNYPGYYPDNKVCRWVLSACNCYDPLMPNADFRVETEVVDFDMQDSPSCTKDFLEIKDGKRLWDHKLSQYCGSKCSNGDNTTRSTGKHALVSFQTDVFDEQIPAKHRGFLARFRCVAADKVEVGPLILGPANYLLIAFSCFLAVLFGSATALLVVHERHRSRNLVD